MKWLMLVMLYPIAPIMFVVLYNHAKVRKNVLIGVTLPYTAQKHPEVESIRARYKRAQIIAFVASTLLFVPAIFIRSDIRSFAWQMMWILVPTTVFYGIFMVYNRKLAAWKWANVAAFPEVTYVPVTIGLKKEDRKPFAAFALPILLAWVPVIYHASKREDPIIIFSLVLMALMPLFCYAMYTRLFRQKKEFFKDDLVSQRLYLVRQKYWGLLTYGLVWTTAVLSLLNFFILMSPAVYMGGMLLITLLMLAFLLYIELRVLKLQEKITTEVPATIYDDEDRYWLFGTFYYNPNDRHVLKNERVGIGQSINLATVPGKILTVITVVAIASIPFLTGWMLHEDATPVSVFMTPTNLVARHTRNTYSLPVDTIIEYELLQELPDLRRVNGAGLDRVLKGRFRSNALGNLKINLDPEVAPYILVRTETETYLFGSADSQQTLRIYRALEERVP